jgi:leucyl-tRNA synthetase
MEYNFREIEQKWQQVWKERKTFRAENISSKPKYYVLDMFPYPSGAGLHVGHPLGYIASDIYARYMRQKGYNVLHPMGYDSFGLPAEQYAIQTGQHPAVTTENNINRYREQLDKIGFSFDWDREVRTSEPNYYKWTQWIFIQLFNSWYNKKSDKAEKIETLISAFETSGSKAVEAVCEEHKSFTAEEWNNFSENDKQEMLLNYRLTYLSNTMVNWCPQLGTVLANEEVKDGLSERGGYPVERKLMKQWSMRITAYAERLLTDLEKIDWTESIKEQQKNWIGKSKGASVQFYLSPDPSPQERGAEVLEKSPEYKTTDSASNAAAHSSPLSGVNSKVEEPSREYYTTDGKMWNLLIDKAKEMRKNATLAEKILWETLRAKSFKYKIRRQHIIDRFIVDFVILSKKLVIEIDGKIHEFLKEEDQERTEALEAKGFKVIRFKNEAVIADVQSVVSEILKELEALPASYPQTENEVKLFEEEGEEYSLSQTSQKAAAHSSPLRGEVRRGVIEVFTTRPDTIFGVTFLTLAPEHELVKEITTPDKKANVEAYVTIAKNRSERERMTEVKRISGEFTGAYAIHPFSGAHIPIWVGDYVLAGYGTGAVMAVPGHDSRDHAFAKHFNIPIKEVVAGGNPDIEAFEAKEGKIVNSDFLNGLEVKNAIEKAIEEIEKKGIGKGRTNYRLRDAIFSRQRYWGEPLPVYFKNDLPYVLNENELPVALPEVDKYLPTETGEPPLARAENWKTKEGFEYEKSTMPGWAGSSWYFYRYMDASNDQQFASKETVEYWRNVDLYIGGSEHATGHLLYARFWNKFLFDLGYVVEKEPFKKLINQGMIQGRSNFVYRLENSNTFISAGAAKGNKTIPIHVDVNIVENDVLDLEAFKTWRPEFANAEFVLEDGKYICGWEVEKMSKSKWNVVNPDTIVERYGADTLRLYEMFLGPLEQSKPWNTNGIEGVHKFLKRLWRLYFNDKGQFEVSEDTPTKQELKSLHKTIKKVKEDIERFSFNTSVSTFMICVNELTDLKCNKRAILSDLAIIISPYAPHIAEELWAHLGNTESITFAVFPEYNEAYLTEDTFTYPVSFNGKTRFMLELPIDMAKEQVEQEVLNAPEAQKWLDGTAPKKVIVVPKKIVNVVV